MPAQYTAIEREPSPDSPVSAANAARFGGLNELCYTVDGD